MIIRFITKNTRNANNLAIIYSDEESYSKASYLNCTDILLNMKKCQISISHFTKQNYKEKDITHLYHSYSNDSLKINY